ncbi:4-hydroxyacetophenone monooxygenase [Mycolicibacterium celeriflavum]|nr:NAD(P)/FAD-dependent oxidoreductase [Mycolicibacterium celeriflavum]MCV7238354.1 NAD(P)/FAD-dependent oxidoreductase [Mycolicibacterium celeriflavum]OBG23911.1 4-hydroxyacetophenone monooxygenase [Mycolicibacterium celeriflavum]ORA51210.1 4-hydroxyacetophenone monooxygenase [Mycolicibacterium celeriflavum]
MHIAIIGSGFAGLGAAVKLNEAGHRDFLVLERGNDVGGTWRDNTYPGAACDVPSHLYSYSFSLNPNWTRSFSTQAEIEEYIRGVARRAGVLDRHVFGCDVKKVAWQEDHHRWELSTSRGAMTADVVIGGFGALAEPSLPPIPGIDDFDGELFHSAQWNHEADLTGKRVAVIGTGASAIQIVPAIADTVAHIDVYQRTAPWLLPRFDRPFTRIERWIFRNIPGVLRLARAGIYAAREIQVLGLAKNPRLMKLFELISRAKIRTEIRDPELRRKVTPNFRIGCKRMLIANDWYPALDRENVELITDGIGQIDGHSIITADGTAREVDAIVVATGFHVTDSPMFETICGSDGRSLSQAFADKGMRAYKGTTIAGYPNLFVLVGPNTGLGHTSMVYMIESQLNYVVDAITTMESRGLSRLDVRQDEQDAYNDELQRKLANSVWMTGGCASWYLDAHGNNTTLWPDFTFRFRRQTKRFDVDAYETAATTRPVDVS